MHLWDEGSGFYGSVPIVAGTVPLAVGAAMASRLRKRMWRSRTLGTEPARRGFPRISKLGKHPERSCNFRSRKQPFRESYALV